MKPVKQRPGQPLRTGTHTSGRQLIIVAVALVTALSLAACGSSGDGEAGTADSPVTLNFVGPEDPATLEPVIKLFEKENPSIQVEYQPVPFNDLNSILETRLASEDSTLDVYTADQPRIPALAAKGFLLDLTEELPEVEDKVLEGSLDASMYQDKLWALPIWSSTQLLYYNKELLSAGKVTPPAIAPADRLTWEQLVTDATAAQDAGAQYGFTFDQVSRYYQLQPLPESMGGGSGLGGDDFLEPDLTNEQWVKAFTWYGELFESGLSPRGVTPEQTPELFTTGKVAYFLGGPWWLGEFQGTEGLDFGVAPHPYFEGGTPATPTDAWSWGINPASEHPEEALAFLKFVSLSEPGATASVESAPFPPANVEAFDSYLTRLESSGEGSLNGISDLVREELTKAAVHRPRSVGYIQFETIMNKAFEDIRNGAEAGAALDQASTDFTEQASRLQ